MNVTQFYHLMLFAVLTTVCLHRFPWWVISTGAALVIELDQAISCSHPWWQWFGLIDTQLDLAADFVGVGLAWVVHRYLWR